MACIGLPLLPPPPPLPPRQMRGCHGLLGVALVLMLAGAVAAGPAAAVNVSSTAVVIGVAANVSNINATAGAGGQEASLGRDVRQANGGFTKCVRIFARKRGWVAVRALLYNHPPRYL